MDNETLNKANELDLKIKQLTGFVANYKKQRRAIVNTGDSIRIDQKITYWENSEHIGLNIKLFFTKEDVLKKIDRLIYVKENLINKHKKELARL